MDLERFFSCQHGFSIILTKVVGMTKTLISTLIIFNTVLIAQTDVSGSITVNTTWTKSGSPYNISSNINVLENIILTIEPGVEVIGTTAFLGNRIDLQGVSVQSKLNEKSFNISL